MPNWKKLIVSGSDALLNSLTVSTTGRFDDDLTISGSSSSLILKGDGNKSARLTHVGGGLVIDGSVQNQYISIGSPTWSWPGGVKVYGDLQLTGSAGGTATFEGSTQSTVNLKTTTNSKNNYIVGTTAGAISFRPDGTESVFLQSGGNVGIGTSTPDNTLELYKETDDAYAGLKITRLKSNNSEYFATYGDNRIVVSDNQAFYIRNGSDNVAKFHDNEIEFYTGGATKRLTIDSTGGNFTGNISGSDVFINGWNSVSASLATLTDNQIDGSGTANYVARFSDADTLTTGLIQDDGSTVGINAGPSSRMLYVNGTGQFNGELFFTHFDAIGTSASRFRDDVILRFGTDRIFGLRYNSTDDKLQFISSSANIVEIDGDGNATFKGSVHLDSDSAQLQFGDDNDMQIFHNGANGKINNATGGITIDSAGDITLDADGGDIRLYDGGVLYGNLANAGGNFHIKNPTQDKDIVFVGNDNGSNVTALTLDMSEGGNATFAGDVTVEGTLTAQEFHTEFVSASIVYESGSTKFGDTVDDNHDFTGSLNLLAQSGASGLDIKRGTNIYMNLNNSSTRNEINFKSTQGLRFYHGTDSTSPLFISSSGEVGINTTAPGEKLTVQDGAIITTDSSGVNYAKLDRFGGLTMKGNGAGSRGIQTPNSDALTFGTNGTERMRISSAGALKFNSYGSGNNTGTLAYSLGVDSSGNIIEFTGGSGGGTVSSITSGADNRIAIFNGTDSLEGDANLTFDGDIFAVNTNELYVSGSRVGIGTTSPNSILEIQSSSPEMTIGASAVNQFESGRIRFTEQRNDSAGFQGGYIHYDGSANKLHIGMHETSDTTVSNDVNAITILRANRNVGIGTTAPSEKFEVDGNVRLSTTGDKLQFANNNVGIYRDTGSILVLGSYGGIYFNAEGTAGIQNQSTRMVITDSGQVGIGTTTPSAKLEIGDSSYVDLLNLNRSGVNSVAFRVGNLGSGDVALDVRLPSTDSRVGVRGAMSIGSGYADSANTGITDGLVVQGNVGIGTTTPDGRLNIRAAYTSSASITNDASDYAINIDFLGANGSIANPQYGAHLAIRDSNGAAVAAINGVDQGAQGATGLSFLTGDVNGLTDRLHITNTGNVGIGTTSPATKLQVEGNVSVTAGKAYRIYNTAGNGWGEMTFNQTDNRIQFNRGIQNSGADFLLHENGDSYINANEGNVGIGTTSPSYKLDVSGSIRAINSAGTGGVYSQNFYITDNSGTVKNRIDNDDVRFYISYGGGTDRALNILNSNGYIGIGTTSPSYILDVDGDIQNNGVLRRGGNVFIKSTGSDTAIGPAGAGTITFHTSSVLTGAAEAMRIDADGNLALNNTSAGARLDIREDTNYAIQAEDASGHYFRVNTGGDVDMRGDLVVQGTITAQEFHTEFVSASIIYDSGSTKFGDTADDNHDFTGSLNLAGQLTIDNSVPIKLLVNSGADNDSAEIRNGSGELKIYSGRTTDATHQSFVFATGDNYTSGATRMVITGSNGNVGIGTTTPSQKLEVNGAVLAGDYRGSTHIYLTSPDSWIFRSTGGTERMKIDSAGSLLLGNTTAYQKVIFDPTPSTVLGNGTLTITPSTAPGSGTAQFYTRFLDRTGGGTTKHNVIVDGKVGIGTTSPGTELQISTTMTSSPTSNIFLDVEGSNTTGGGGSIIFGTSASAGTPSTYNAKITGTRVSGGTGGDSQLGFWTTLVSDSTNPQERMTITKEGNVGIGTSTPGEKLDVNGSVQANNFKVAEKIIHKGDAHTFIHFTSDTITFDTGGSTVLTLDSSQNVNATGTISGSDVYINDWGSVSASLASIQTAGGVNGTGAADRVTIWSDSDTVTSDDLYWDSSNNRLGIGVSPSQPLDVNGTALIRNTVYVGDNIQHWGDGGTGLYFGTDTLSLQNDGGTTRLHIAADGNIGIGTTSPGTGYAYDIKLDIVAPQLGGIPLRLVRDSSTTNYGAMLALAAKNSNSEIITYGAITGGIVDSTDGSEDGFVSIRTIKNGTEAEKVRVDEDGNVGIGTTSPTQKLQVEGNIYTGGSIRIEDTGDQLEFGNANVALQRTSNLLELGGYDGIVFKSSNNVLDSQTERMRITSAGNVGIGTTSPSSLLHLYSTAPVITGTSTNNSSGLRYNVNGTAQDVHRFQYQGSTLVVIKSTGNVGIGETSPLTRLHVKLSDTAGTKSNYGKVLIEDTDAHLDLLSTSDGTWGSSINFIEATGSGANKDIWSIARKTTAGNGDSSLNFNFGTNNQHDNTNRVQFTSTGNIKAAGNLDIDGTGTSTIAGDLTVAGTLTAQEFHTEFVSASIIYESGSTKFGDTSDDNHDFTGSVNVTGSIDVHQTVDNNGITIHSSNVQPEIIFKDDATGDTFSIGHNRSGNRMDIEINGTDAHTFTQGGNVGIGTTSPDESLHVNGNIKGNTLYALDDVVVADKILHYGDTDTYIGFEDNTQRFFAAGEEMIKFNSSIVTINEASGNNDLRVKGNTDNNLFYTDGSTDRVGIGTSTPSAKLDVEGDVQIKSANISYQENTDVDSAAAETIASVSTGSFTGAFFDYTCVSGSNARAGTVMAVNVNGSVEFTDNSTKDIGDTSGVTFSVDISGTDLRLRATTTSDNWIIKSLVRSI